MISKGSIAAREDMVAALEERLKSNPKGLISNRVYARFLLVPW